MRGMRKGMILAAGLGTRLHPITHKIPKPLVPVLNLPNILYSIDLLARAGIREIVVNAHHLADRLMKHLGDGTRWGVHLTYSREEILLGTGGGVKKAESFFGGEPFVLTNSDFITDADLTPWTTSFPQSGSLATMVLLDDPKLTAHYSRVGIDEAGRLCSLPSHTTRPPSRAGLFTGIHFLQASTLSHLQPIPSGINQVLYPALMKESPDRVQGVFFDGPFWMDTGDLYFLWDTSMQLLDRLGRGERWIADLLNRYGGYREARPGLWAAPGTKAPEGVSFDGPVLLGAGCTLERGARVASSVLGDGCRLSAGAAVARSVLLPGAAPEKGSRIVDSLAFETQTLSLKKNSAGD